MVLAPMSGVTDMPFRRLVKKWGASLVVSEMIASRAMIMQTKASLKKAKASLDEQPASVQLAGCDPDVMAEAAKLNEDLGARIIDINMGCPVKKVTNGFAGSALMKDLKHAQKILEATVKAVSVPVTLKMRTGWNETNRNAPELAKIAEDVGIEMLTVHGRTRTQLYSGKADWSFIRSVKDALTIPVIANGDIRNCSDAEECLLLSGADGVMVGRGCYGRPWLVSHILHYFKTGEVLPEPSVEVRRDTVLKHIEDIFEHYGNAHGVLLARKHIGWYSKSLHGSAEFRSKVNQEMNHKIVLKMTREYFDTACEEGGNNIDSMQDNKNPEIARAG